jgi:hypothetical protein
MATHYGNTKATFYRDFVTQQSLNPTNGSIGGPIGFSRSTSGTYIGSDGYIKTAAANEPRFTYEYDSSGVLQYRGLYVDAQRTSYNYFNYSEDFSQAVWTKTNSSISSTSTLSPDGVTNGSKISLSSSGGNINYALTSAGNASTSLKRQLTVSIMAKAVECQHLNIKIDNGTTTVDCYYNLSTGALGNNTNGLGAHYPSAVNQNGLQFLYKHICNMGNGWYRCILSVEDSITVSSANYTISFIPSSSASSISLTNTNDGILIWGAMVDTILTSFNYHYCFANYIKTTGSSASCGVETCYVSNSDATENNLLAGYSADSCSIYAEFTTPYFFIGTIVGTIISLGATSKYSTSNSASMRINTNTNTTGYVTYLYRPPAQSAFDFNVGSPVSISSTNNKMIITNRQYAPVMAAMNGSTGTSALGLVPQKFNILGLGGVACYKKLFYVPTYFNSNQLIRLTTL